jgi:hypothetical protein
MSDAMAQFRDAFFSETAAGGFEAAYGKVRSDREARHV